jgi:hypothetical protein
LNPRQNQYFQAKFVTDKISPGIGTDGVLRDPWGNPYIVSLDLYSQSVCSDPVYGSVPGSVMIWSFGPDKTATTDPNDPLNKDNVKSWSAK